MATTRKNPKMSSDQPPSIRIVPHIEGPRSLHFDIIEREIPKGTIIKVGRFTDKAHVPNRVTFRSKVVSRGHAEIWCEDGKFYIKDTKSSSGTFLNHVRLSSPGQESKPHQLKDGDVVQLGVDYQGGTEEIYRCVKMRIELNRSWQRQINNFNLNALKQLRQLTGPDAFKHQTTDCCICLSSIAPCQALFLAPCSHVFHYKCIRPLLVNHHPGFLCPLCRSFADLEASTEITIDWEQALAEEEESAKKETGESTKNISQPTCDTTVIEAQPTQPTSTTTEPSTNTTNIQKNLAETSTQSNTVVTPEKLNTIQVNGHSLSSLDEEDINLLFMALNSLSSSSPTTTSPVIPIPSKNNKTQDSSEENDDPNTLILSCTLPSSPPVPYFIESGPSSLPSNSQSSHSDKRDSQKLGEIAEEDEGSISSSSSGQAGRLNHEKHQDNSLAQDLSSSSANTSDNDEDGLQFRREISTRSACGENFTLITSDDGFINVTAVPNTTSSRSKGKGVQRFNLSRKENVM